jgi:hypothetical protein
MTYGEALIGQAIMSERRIKINQIMVDKNQMCEVQRLGRVIRLLFLLQRFGDARDQEEKDLLESPKQLSH